MAVVASLDHAHLRDRIATMLRSDEDAAVRRECAEVLGRSSGTDPGLLLEALTDEAATVREAAVTALSEIADDSAVDALLLCAADEDEDGLVREAAVAALGTIGSDLALPLLLELVATGPPQVRRRCVAALTVFDGPAVEQALRAAAHDRNPMVREAAEMVVGRSIDP